MIVNFTGTALEENKSKRLCDLHDKLMQGQKLENNERGYLGHTLADGNGVFRLMGWCYNFREFLTLYVVKTKHYGLMERWAFNATQVRLDCRGDGPIYYIVEVAKKENTNGQTTNT